MKIRREDLQDLYPLSPMQEGMLLHARQDPDSPAYREQVVWRLTGPFDVAVYEKAWHEAHARYEALRSVFTHERSREPLQLVLKTRPADVRVDALADLPAADRERRVREIRAEERAARFDIGSGPLLRVRVSQLSPEDHQVVVTWHHILLDGWSTHQLLRDVATLYQALVSGTAAALPPMSPYAGYVEWLKAQDRHTSLAYWGRLLRGCEAVTEIPRVHEGTPGPFRLSSAEVVISDRAETGIRQLAASTHATMSSIVQAAWTVVLGRYSDSEDVVFGAVVSGRSPEVPGIESIAGLLINTIPVRVTWSGHDSFADLVARVHQQSVDGQPHHACRLAEVLNPTGLGADLIRHLVVFENYPAARGASLTGGLTVEMVEATEPTTYDLLVVAEPGDRLKIALQYNAEVYAPAYAAEIAKHLGTCLEHGVMNSGVRLDALDISTPEERTALAGAFTSTARPYPSTMNLAIAFALAVEQHADRLAIVDGTTRLTYRDLDRRSNRMAQHLAAQGLGPGDRIATVLDRSPLLVETILAIVKLGAVYVPIDLATPPERLAWLTADAGVRSVVALTTADLAIAGVALVAPDADAAAIDAQPDSMPIVSPARPSDEAVLFYTSGSTGVPKAVRVPHRAILRLVMNSDYVAFAPGDRIAHVSNVAFDAATMEIWGALLNGAELHPFQKELALTPAALGRELRERAITTMFVTTALVNQMAREAPDTFGSLHTLLFGGERVEPAWIRRLLARGRPARLLHVYGPTETTTFATWHEVSSVPDGAMTIPIGRPIANTTAYVVDRHDRPQPIGALGELLIGGDGVSLGYHDRPDLTASAFVRDPVTDSGRVVYRTGDIVRRNLQGDIEFIGRRDGQIKLRGFRIEPGEIEAALRTYPHVADAVVLVHEDEATADRRLVAYLALPGPTGASVELDLRNHLRQRLPAYMIPSTFVVLERLPLNANGKIDRAALPSPTRSGMGFARTFVEPATDLEKQVAAIWQSTLGVAAVGRHDNFFELGGHSLTASTAISHIRVALKVEVPMAAFFRAPSLDELCAAIAELQATAAPVPAAVTRLSRDRRRPGGPAPVQGSGTGA
jgi:amino acid adenylation domain-containing protein